MIDLCDDSAVLHISLVSWRAWKSLNDLNGTAWKCVQNKTQNESKNRAEIKENSG